MQYRLVPCAEGDEDLIREQIDAIADSIVPPEEGAKDETLVFRIDDGEGNIAAGCILEIDSWRIADLDILWVDEPRRNQGLGACLLGEVEREARENGAYLLLAGGTDWQVPFFRKHSYAVNGAIEDCPMGHSEYLLAKRL